MKKYLLVVLIALSFSVASVWAAMPSEQWPALEDLETMAPAEEARFIAEWDASFSKGLMNGPGELLGRLAVFPNSEAANFFRMKYNNPALVERVVELYIAELQRRLDHDIKLGEVELNWPETTGEREEFLRSNIARRQAELQRSVAREGNLIQGLPEENRSTDVIGEMGDLDYLEFLETLAVTTFSPRLLDYIGTFAGGDARLEYHARVEPEGMLKAIFTATPSAKLEYDMNYAFLYRSDTGAPLGIEFTFECIEKIAEQNPLLGEKYHDEIINFIKQYGKIYFRAKDLESSRKKHLLDYRQRVRGLNILRRVSISEDIPVVRWLAEDTQLHDVKKYTSFDERAQARREGRPAIVPDDIGIIAERVIEEIHRRGK